MLGRRNETPPPPSPPAEPAAEPAESATRFAVVEGTPDGDTLDGIVETLIAEIAAAIPLPPRKDIAQRADVGITRALTPRGQTIDDKLRRDTITRIVNGVLRQANAGAPKPRSPVLDALDMIYQPLLERIDVARASAMQRAELAREVDHLVGELLVERRIQMNQLEQRDLVTAILNEMLGFGPIEPLLADDTVADILINGAKQVYVERLGKLQLTDVTFRDETHVMQIAVRIASGVGRRIDESNPLVDARLPDGSRVNIIGPPLALDGTSISIRKFSRQRITLDRMVESGSISPALATVLKIASRTRLNVIVAGGTGSGKTTLLNALSQLIDPGERVVTIEDAAELQLQQPHVVRLETRPASIEGKGEITQRLLVKNALRMRPDRIILGEIRGEEALDVLQAMNTGHDGSMTTIHANSPREALTRLENMVAMAGVKLPVEAVRQQIAGAVNLIVHVSRMRDGSRRIGRVTEVTGMEGDILTTQDLFTYKVTGEDSNGRLIGHFECSRLRPHFLPRAEYFGLDRALIEAMDQ